MGVTKTLIHANFVLEKDTFPPLRLKESLLCPDMSEKLLTVMLHNKTYIPVHSLDQVAYMPLA